MGTDVRKGGLSGSSFADKDRVEQVLQVGIHGAPELGSEEKRQYLGEFRERVIRMLTMGQVKEPFIYTEIEKALQHPKASKLVLNGELGEEAAGKYRKLALRLGKLYTVRRDPGFEGEAGLVVVASDAVDAPNIGVESREERLKRKGLPEGLIEAAGKPICKACYQQVRELAPEEAGLYKVISPINRLFGEKCAAHEA